MKQMTRRRTDRVRPLATRREVLRDFDSQVGVLMAYGHSRQSAIEQVQFSRHGGDLRAVDADGIERPYRGRSIFDD